MDATYNGMPAAELGDVRWIKSQYSNGTGECVELATLPTGEIAMRNSRFPAGPVLVYTQAEIKAFLAGARDGEFDQMAGLFHYLLTSSVAIARHLATQLGHSDAAHLRKQEVA